MSLKDYPLFIPPVEVSEKSHREWTLKEAKLYFEWFTSIKDVRVEYLLTILEENLSPNTEKDLKRIGKKAYKLFFEDLFSTKEESSPVLTNRGLALAADMGLLIGQCLLSTNCELRWDIVKRPKSDVAFHLPVIMGFIKRDYVDIVRVSIVDAKAILREEKTSDAWWEVFEYCITSDVV